MKLTEKYFPEVETILQGWERSVKRVPNGNFTGTRDSSEEGVKNGRPYVWKTYRECDEITTNFSRG